MRFLHHCFLWVLTVSSLIFGYTFVTIKDWFAFMFNVPVDAWVMIREAFEEADAEVEAEDESV